MQTIYSRGAAQYVCSAVAAHKLAHFWRSRWNCARQQPLNLFPRNMYMYIWASYTIRCSVCACRRSTRSHSSSRACVPSRIPLTARIYLTPRRISFFCSASSEFLLCGPLPICSRSRKNGRIPHNAECKTIGTAPVLITFMKGAMFIISPLCGYESNLTPFVFSHLFCMSLLYCWLWISPFCICVVRSTFNFK